LNYIKKFKKNAKGLSPVIASIILIAVTVAVSVVVAAWMGGMTIGLMGNTEQATVTNAVFSTDGSSINATIRNTGGANVVIQSATLDGNAGTLTPTGTIASLTIPKGQTGCIIISGYTLSPAITSGAQYNLKLTTAKGNTLTYPITFS